MIGSHSAHSPSLLCPAVPQFSNLCGSVYSGGSVCFTPDGSTLLSPVGNRITAFHLLAHRSVTMPVSLPATIAHLAVSPSPSLPLLLAVDVTGRALFIHYTHRRTLFDYSFGQPVTAVAFSPSARFLAVACSNTILLFLTPSAASLLLPSHRPLHLHRRLTPHHSAITALRFSHDDHYLMSGSADLTARIHTLGSLEGWAPLTLSGHRAAVVGVYWAGRGTGAEGEQAVTRVYTISQDGALLQWKWIAVDAPVASSAPSASLSPRSHRHRPPRPAPGSVSLFGVSGRFILASKHFFSANTHGSVVTASCLHHTPHGVDLLLVSFSSGSFSLYELPAFTMIHSLSVSASSLSSLSISPSGHWIAAASARTGSLLVWEWQSESYILRQQGHAAAVSSLSYSADSAYIATGGEDGRVKVWHASNGFCFKTFSHHTAPVTAVLFAPSGNVILSSSADGSVNAYDLVRYRLFRTFATPTPAQLSCLCTDNSGELVIVGSSDPFELFIFSMQTGRLLDVLPGHEGPVSGLAFSPSLSLLLSSSWDKTVKLWDPFEGKGCVETLQHDSEVLCLAVSPSGLQLAAALLDGSVSVWDIRSSTVTGVLEVGLDIAPGRSGDDVRTVRSRGGGHVTSMCWSADGGCLLVGGNSRWVAIYDVDRRLLLKRFAVSSNERLDGVKDRLNSRYVNDPTRGREGEEEEDGKDVLPGAKTGDRSERRWTRQVRSRCVRFAPTGLQWAAATNEGLLLYALDDDMIFDPTDLGQCTADILHAGSAAAAAVSLRLSSAALMNQPRIPRFENTDPRQSRAVLPRHRVAEQPRTLPRSLSSPACRSLSAASVSALPRSQLWM